MSISTRKGDKGETGVVFGHRVAKDSLRVEAYGTADELIAALGVARAEAENLPVAGLLFRIQQDLLLLSGELAVLPEDNQRYEERKGASMLAEEALTLLDEVVAEKEKKLPPLRTWRIPGKNRLSAHLDFARTVCRRTERLCVRVDREQGPLRPLLLAYLNRLSDVLWLLSYEAEVADS